jgi:hypothetical protein
MQVKLLRRWSLLANQEKQQSHQSLKSLKEGWQEISAAERRKQVF